MNYILRYLAFFLILLSVWGCKKKDNGPASSRMNGTFMWTGETYPPVDTSTFLQLNVTVLNATTVVVRNDTLTYISTDASGIIAFYHDYDSPPVSNRINEGWLYYNPANNSMSYRSESNGSYFNAGEKISTERYKPNHSLHNYVSDIAGVKAISGQVTDSFGFTSATDTLYSVNVNTEFTILNDSTISFSNDVLLLGENTLHYRSTNAAAGTVTYQTFNYQLNRYSTLTFNYQTRQITFEQFQLLSFGRKKRLIAHT